jgi:glycosyltransferase involved in cell wall biosynthesis
VSDISVIVATRDRPGPLTECLESLRRQTLAPTLIVVVDDDPGGAATPAVVARFGAVAPVAYVAGPRRGLAAAHNAGLRRVSTRLVAFTDDDVVAAPEWLAGIAGAFACAPGVACVTGRIVARELDTPVQVAIDRHGGFDKGERRRVFRLGGDHGPLFPFAAGTFGSGANMAFDRVALGVMGGFDPALGTGTPARGGDDLAAFFEVVQRGWRLVYEPAAVVRHSHAREPRALRRQVFGYGVGLSAYLTKSLLGRPLLLAAALRRLPAAAAHVRAGPAGAAPAGLRPLQLVGMLLGPFAYLASRRRAAREAW